MKNSNYLQYEDYLKDILTETERKALEELLQKDLDARKEFEKYKKLRSHLTIVSSTKSSSKELEHNLETLGKKYFIEQKPTKIFNMKKSSNSISWMRAFAASAIILVCVLGGTVGVAEMKFSNKAIAQNVNTPNLLPNFVDSTVRGESETTANLSSDQIEFIKANKAYNNKQYTEAIAAFENYKVLNTMEDEKYRADYFMALSYLATDKEFEARKILDNMSNGSSNKWSKEADILLDKMNSIMHRIASIF